MTTITAYSGCGRANALTQLEKDQKAIKMYLDIVEQSKDELEVPEELSLPLSKLEEMRQGIPAGKSHGYCFTCQVYNGDDPNMKAVNP